MAHSNHQGPSYYKRGNIDVWDFIREQGLNFHLGNAIKYICRAGYKDDRITDLRKAIHYLQNELEHTILAYDASPGLQKSLSDTELIESYCASISEEFDR
jgi:hypothetical protein